MSAAPFRAERPEPSSGAAYYHWEVPGKPVSVRLALSVIDRLERAALDSFRSLTSRGSEMGGILWGSVAQGKPSVVTVDEFEAIACDYSRGPLYRLSDADTGLFDASIERGSKGMMPVGFFRSHTRKDLGMDEDDLSLFNSRFKEPWKIALLIRPFATKTSVAGIFIRENGRIAADASCLEFPFQTAELARQGRATPAVRPAAPQHPAPAPAPAAKPVPAAPVASRLKIALPDPPAPPPPAEPELNSAVVETVPEPVHKQEMTEERVRPVVRVQPEPELPAPRQNADAGTSTVETEVVEIDDDEDTAADGASPGLLQKLLKKKLVLAAAGGVLLLCSGALFVYPGMFRASSRPPVALTLRVERTAGDLLLTWNRESEVIRNAKHAVLSIYDGERTENYNMDLNQLRDGSIVYAPVTADVSFKMEVTGPDGSKVGAESVRVLRTRPSPMPDENAAKNAQQQGKTPAATPAPDAAAAAAATTQQTDTAEKVEEEQAPAPTKLAQASRAFNVASLAQRLRPASGSDLPDAPAVSAGPGSAPIGGLNLGANSGPAFAPRKASSEGSTGAASQLQQAQVVRKVPPAYPAIAQRANAAGTVRLTAVVGTDGKVKRVLVNSGNPLLQQAAVDAVKQWVYRPTILNGKPVESEVEVSLEFKR